MFLMEHTACIYQTDLISPVSEIKMVIWGLSRSLELFYQQYESFTKYYCSKTGSEGYQTTRTETSRPVSENKSAHKYVKTTRTV